MYSQKIRGEIAKEGFSLRRRLFMQPERSDDVGGNPFSTSALQQKINSYLQDSRLSSEHTGCIDRALEKIRQNDFLKAAELINQVADRRRNSSVPLDIKTALIKCSLELKILYNRQQVTGLRNIEDARKALSSLKALANEVERTLCLKNPDADKSKLLSSIGSLMESVETSYPDVIKPTIKHVISKLTSLSIWKGRINEAMAQNLYSEAVEQCKKLQTEVTKIKIDLEEIIADPSSPESKEEAREELRKIEEKLIEINNLFASIPRGSEADVAEYKAQIKQSFRTAAMFRYPEGFGGARDEVQKTLSSLESIIEYREKIYGENASQLIGDYLRVGIFLTEPLTDQKNPAFSLEKIKIAKNAISHFMTAIHISEVNKLDNRTVSICKQLGDTVIQIARVSVGAGYFGVLEEFRAEEFNKFFDLDFRSAEVASLKGLKIMIDKKQNNATCKDLITNLKTLYTFAQNSNKATKIKEIESLLLNQDSDNFENISDLINQLRKIN